MIAKALVPRAGDPVPRRADGRRRRRAAPRHVGAGARAARRRGVTIILTTHYIEEAEEMADRIGIISKGELILVEEKAALMRKLGKKQLTLQLQSPLAAIPAALAAYRAGAATAAASWSSPTIPRASAPASPRCSATSARPESASGTCRPAQSSLEDIFVNLVRSSAHEPSRGQGDLRVRDGAHAGARSCRASSRR